MFFLEYLDLLGLCEQTAQLVYRFRLRRALVPVVVPVPTLVQLCLQLLDGHLVAVVPTLHLHHKTIIESLATSGSDSTPHLLQLLSQIVYELLLLSQRFSASLVIAYRYDRILLRAQLSLQPRNNSFQPQLLVGKVF